LEEAVAKHSARAVIAVEHNAELAAPNRGDIDRRENFLQVS
jgi:hypothetical protein